MAAVDGRGDDFGRLPLSVVRLWDSAFSCGEGGVFVMVMVGQSLGAVKMVMAGCWLW